MEKLQDIKKTGTKLGVPDKPEQQPDILRDSQFDNYIRMWSLQGPTINNYIINDPIIKGYSAGAFTSMALIGGEAYVGQTINYYKTNTVRTILINNIKSAFADGLGQYANNKLQGKGWTQSYEDINLSSTLLSGGISNPTFTAFMGNNILSNTFQYRIGEGGRLGTTEEILSGTTTGVVFGVSFGRIDGGLLNRSNSLKKQALTNIAKGKLFNTNILLTKGAFSNIVSSTRAGGLNALQYKLLGEQQLKLSNMLKVLEMTISTMGETSKNFTNNIINK